MVRKRYNYLRHNCALLQEDIFDNKACFAEKLHSAGCAFVVF